MTVTRARVILVGIFLVSLVIQVGVVVATYVEGAIAAKDLSSLLPKLLAIYSVHLAVIFGGIFAQIRATKQVNVQPMPFWIATVVAALWNLLLLWRSVAFGVAGFNVNIEDSVSSFSTYLDDASKASSFLVVGALAFFFTKRN